MVDIEEVDSVPTPKSEGLLLLKQKMEIENLQEHNRYEKEEQRLRHELEKNALHLRHSKAEKELEINHREEIIKEERYGLKLKYEFELKKQFLEGIFSLRGCVLFGVVFLGLVGCFLATVVLLCFTAIHLIEAVAEVFKFLISMVATAMFLYCVATVGIAAANSQNKRTEKEE